MSADDYCPEGVLYRTVSECIADIDMEDIGEMLARVRNQLPDPNSVLWTQGPCELEIYRQVIAELGHPPQKSDWDSEKSGWSEEGAAA